MSNLLEKLEKLIPDPYDRIARLYPILLLLLPALLSFWSIVPEKFYNWEAMAGLVFWCGLGLLLKELGRESGKKKEKKLWGSWGGPPSTQYLRHRGTTNKVTLKRVHKKLQGVIPDIEIPTLEFEQNQPGKADEIYEECTRVMRNKTRDTKRFPLVFKELCSYGFWRNLCGLKTWGIAISVLCLFTTTTALYLQWRSSLTFQAYDLIVSEIFNIAFSVFWLSLTENKIKISAFAYAERLFETTESIANDIQLQK